MKSLFDFGIFHRKRKRALRSVQIEVTSRCTRSCIICPRFHLAHLWREGDLEKETWKIIEPDLNLGEHVHLQGWGEPLLNPLLPLWVEKAHEAGCSVGITTNGELLNEAEPWLMEGMVSLLTVSVAGSYNTHAQLRDGSKLESVLFSMEELAAHAREIGLRIKIQLSFLLTRNNSSELTKVVEHAAHAGLDEVFVTHLDCIPSETLYNLAAYKNDTLFSEIASDITNAERVARRKGIVFRSPSLKGEEVLCCALNPLDFVFVSWDGRVGPCVNLLLPIKGQIPRWSENGVTNVEPFFYGTLGETTLSDLMISPERAHFIEPFRKRFKAEKRFVSACDIEPSTRALRNIDRADEQRAEALHSNPFPKECSACPKTLGW